MTLVPNYVPTDWVDTVTTVDATRMDNLDVAVDQHADAINALDTRTVTLEGRPVTPAVVNGKWAKGVGGAMVWSDITIADIATLQTTLDAKEVKTAKGVANGYASLDSGGKVPTTQLPVSIDLRWAGTYAGATAYKEGDVVIYNGVSYIALRPTTGETPVPWSSAAGGSLPYYTATLASDFVLATGTAYQDVTGMTLASVPAGTYLLVGTCYVVRAGNANYITMKVWDGTAAPVAATEGNTAGFSSGQGPTLSLTGLVTLAATTTLKLSIAQAANGHTVKATGAAGGNPPGTTNLTMVKIA
jgi:Carbohydrate-binding module family 5/12